MKSRCKGAVRTIIEQIGYLGKEKHIPLQGVLTRFVANLWLEGFAHCIFSNQKN